jgi:hypothetical protein
VSAYTATKIDGTAFAAVTARQGAIRNSPLFGKLVMTTSFTTDDTISMCPIPAGARILAIVIDAPALDSGSGMTIAVGDNAQSYATTGQSTRLITNALITSAKMVSLAVNGNAGGLGRKYTTADTVILTVVTGPQTGTTTGTITFMVDYSMDT